MSWLPSFRKNMPNPPSGEDRGSDETMRNFTPRAQQALALARREADRLNHNFVGTEHLLLGLISLGQGVAVTVLQKLGIDLERAREEVEKQVGRLEQKVIGNIPYTPRVKKVLALAAKEAKSLNHTYIGTEHILLGLLQEGDGVAAHVLQNFKVDIEQTRQEILKELDPNFDTAEKTIAIRHQEPSKDSCGTVQNPQPERIDTSKRYDVYCAERGQEVIYRNARFKGRSTLLPRGQHDLAAEFIELEQADGTTLFISRVSIIKFCEHGQKPGSATA